MSPRDHGDNCEAMVQYAPIGGSVSAGRSPGSASPHPMSPGTAVNSNLFRFNLVDTSGAVSVVGPAHGLKVLAAACSQGPGTIGELLHLAQPLDKDWIEQVKRGLMVFDEHNVGEVADAYAPVVTRDDDSAHPAFRIIDQTTRTRSMVPARLGLVVVNLRTQRIIQIHNSYAELRRKGRGRIRSQGVPTRSLFHYELPEAWSIVP